MINIPTQLTILRIFLAFAVLYLVLLDGALPRALALLGFAAAGFTDWLDGYLARKWNQTSPMGALLDPIADKILTLGMFIVFVPLGYMPLWMVVLIVIREVSITAVRMVKAKARVVLAAEIEGKWKTTVQIIAISLILLHRFSEAFVLSGVWRNVQGWLAAAIPLFVWLALLLTVYSGVMFVLRNKQKLFEA